jgi:NAD(P)-dependent dehydrogenase (short-subunit alcohol dehydrogenase family)
MNGTPSPQEPAPAALVTGSSRGIGRAIAFALAARGWDIGVHFARNREAAEETRAEIERLGRRAALCPGDLASASERAAILEAFRAAFGRLDALVNNAGMAPRQRADVLDLTEASYDEVLDANLKGPLFLSIAAARWMLEIRDRHPERTLHIVNISSVSEYAATPARAAYCISKSGVGMMTRILAMRLAEAGIQVNEIRPGIIATDMTAGVRELYDRRIAEGLSPMRRWGRPEDVARAVASLVSGDFPFSTGAAFDVDGGFHLPRL